MRDDPHELGVRTARFTKDPASEDLLESLNAAIRDIPIRKSPPGSLPPIVFIVGVPRSGTTLLSQLVSRFLDVGYISNLIARFWSNPVLGIRLSRTVIDDAARSRIDLRSQHGTTDGPWGPHEFGYFWREMFDLDHSITHRLTATERGRIDRERLKARLVGIASEFARPVVFKNPICGFQASILEECYPNSLFICTERNDDDVVESIRRVRLERFGSEDIWWSLKPSSYAELSVLAPAAVQIRAQVSNCRNDFASEFARLTRPPLRVSYDEMRVNPLDVLARIRNDIGTMGHRVRLIDESELLRSPRDVGVY